MHKKDSMHGSVSLMPSTEASITSLRGGGKSLSDAERAFFEPRFGADFSNVRVHAGSQAGGLAETLRAKAFTVNRDIVFGIGQYSPGTSDGRRLLAHELTHVVQQNGGMANVQRLCDPAGLSGRTAPVFFPQETTVMDVFNGTQTLVRWTSKRIAVGLVQQALVDLGYNLGAFGPRGDGVDRKFGPVTEQAIRSFQTTEAIGGAAPGMIDQPTIRCLDEVRSKRVVPAHRTGTVPPSQFQIEDQLTGGRDEDIFFERGSSTLDSDDKAKIGRLVTKQRGCKLTFHGFISEDELVDFGPGLASDRINAVNAEFFTKGHDNPGTSCPNPIPPLRALLPHPAESSGVGDYRSRRKVEIVAAGGTPTTLPCPPSAPLFRTLTAAELATVNAAITVAVGWMNTAIGKLTPGHVEGDPALTAYFGGTGLRNTVKTNLKDWSDHLDTVVRTNNRHATPCNTVCQTAIAFNQGVGGSAQMTVCPVFFGSLSFHPPLSQDEKKAFVLMHEAGHGSIGTQDTAYGHRRLIEFLALYPTIALTNTDSYTLMVLCLNSFPAFCAPPVAADTPVGMTTAEAKNSRRGLGWLETWLTFGEQDLSGLYIRLNTARETGQSVQDISTAYAAVFTPFIKAFDIHRPPGDPPPTFREQTTVAVARDRVLVMNRASRAGLTVEKDASATPTMNWVTGGPLGGPGRHVFLTDAYFVLTTDRQRVTKLLPLIIAASSSIDAVLRPAYEEFIKENVRLNRGNVP